MTSSRNTSEFYCQFWCKPHNKARYICNDCGDQVYDDKAFFCKLCSDRQHANSFITHKLTDIREYIKLHRSVSRSSVSTSEADAADVNVRSVLLVDDCEKLCVQTVEDLADELGLASDHPVNVVSIFGNTGDGKSHTLNHVFFGGSDVFVTSNSQKPGTVGMWVAYDTNTNTLVIDTEGLLGVSSNLNRRTRLLLKILALSDIAIYRTRAERLHNDMFTFLSDASTVYCDHFSRDLQGVLEKHNIDVPISKLGPKVLIFHETQFTETLDTPVDQVITEEDEKPSLPSLVNTAAEDEITARFTTLGPYPQAYSKIKYFGLKSGKEKTDFGPFREEVILEVNSSNLRNRKSLKVIMESLQVLNGKFSNKISSKPQSTFSDDFFRCPVDCLCCGEQCTRSVSHEDNHTTTANYCRYQHQYKNRIYICVKCYNGGKRREVVPKSYEENEGALSGMMKLAWSGYVIECVECGVIYRSRQYWYGNKEPEQETVRTEIIHVWPGEESRQENTGRYVLDQINVITDTIGQYSAGPTQMVTDWLTDQVAPPYWVPNNLVAKCYACKTEFVPLAHKHHCRACGQGFCGDCSSQSKPVQWRGWGEAPVRVCDRCFSTTDKELTEEFLQSLTAWKVTECLKSAASVVKTVVEVPVTIVTDAVRPEYWVPDVDIIDCYNCKEPLTEKHHCRSCGQGFCGSCSTERRPVPDRGWEYPVRVCDTCATAL